MRHIIDDDNDLSVLYEQPLYEPPGDIRDDELIGVISRFGAGRPRTAHRADNDNNPDRVTRMVPFNGGCSTTSGRTPVTMPRLVANDNTPDAEAELAGRAVNDHALRVAA